MKIALEADLSFLENKLAKMPGVEVYTLPNPDAINTKLDIDALLISPINCRNFGKIAKHCRDIKWIHILGTGADAFPLELSRGRTVTCSRGATAGPISEWVLAMMLSFAKQLPARRLTAPPKSWYMADLSGLAGKTLGLVGFGAIGNAVAKKALAFDMAVIAKVRTHRESPMPGVTFEQDLETLLSKSDHIVLALPATPDSHHLINTHTLMKMKPGTHLVNISRADLVDQDALRTALDAGHIAHASLDVVSPEPLPAGHWMYAHPRIFLSPHISWNSPDSQARIIAPFFDNVKAFMDNRPLAGIVNPAAGY